MLWQLFLLFLKVGLIAFGGGYAVMALIQREVAGQSWIGDEAFQQIVAVAGMAPGSIATNAATLIGYTRAGLWGSIVSTTGIILPSLLLVMLFALFLVKHQQSAWVKSSFYGLRPVITALIIYAAVQFGWQGLSGGLLTWSTAGTLLICAACLIGFAKYRLHPFAIILLSAVAGIVLF